MNTYNILIAGFERYNERDRVFCLFNFSGFNAFLSWKAFSEHGVSYTTIMKDLWSDENVEVGRDHEYLKFEPFHFIVLKVLMI
ncbi:MAG: hypothetical protein H7X99_01935 [Saprospiraceae bacterium]|nr:hypothetical protein [Saprospiraceae bacterium]